MSYNMTERPLGWFENLPQNVKALYCRAVDFENGGMFSDMLFQPGSATYSFLSCQHMDGGTWTEAAVTLPDELEYFNYMHFTFLEADLPEGVAGQFDGQRQELTIAPGHADDVTLLHELVHLHEYVVNSLPLFFHDVCLYALYQSLQESVTDLDDRLKYHGNVLNEYAIAEQGGTHDLLFLLKSYDLDQRQGYSLGTVFGYAE